MKTMKINFKQLIMMIILMLLLNINTTGQDVISLNQPFPNFTLTNHLGEAITLSDYKGKNVLLIFPRGKYHEGWCKACHYQYAELASLEQNEDIRKKNNLEILFVLPYSLEVIQHWTTLFPSQMEIIKKWKNPSEAQKQNSQYMEFVKDVQRSFPIDFEFDNDNPAPLPFSILADEDHKVSVGLGLYTMNWDNEYFEQNEPAIFILDAEGTVKFKYKSQVTLDRPSANYLLDFIDKIILK